MEKDIFVPKGWKRVSLGEVGCVIRGVSYKPEQSSQNYQNEYICLLRSNNVDKNCINYNNVIYVDLNCVNDNQIMRKNDILICAANGSRNLVGKSGRKVDNTSSTFGAFMCIFRCFNKVNAPFVSYFLQSNIYEKKLDEILSGSVINNLNGKMIESFPLLLPTSLSEQQQIASILSAADSAIEQTETLIEKYKNIKKGLMQDLLNPKEGWKMMELESVANIVTGSTPSTQDSSNYGHDYLFVGPGDLGNDIFINKTEKNLSAKGFSLCRKIPKNSILYTCIGSTIGKCGISDCELATNQQINSVIPHKGIDYMYLFYILLSKTEKIKEMAGTQAVPLVNKSLFSQILVPIPDISEQQRIAEILSLVDEQIRRLESSLKKQREQKLGLMDDLLTGRVRVTKLLNN